MFNAPNDIHKNWEKVCYIAKKLEPTIDEYGYELDNNYAKPEKCRFNYQPVKDESEMKAYGITEVGTIKAYLDYYKFNGKINEYDLAYLYGAEPINEKYNGEKANYRVITVIPQNTKILVYFSKIIKTK